MTIPSIMKDTRKWHMIGGLDTSGEAQGLTFAGESIKTADATPNIGYESETNENAYIWTAAADWGADDNALWLKNDSSTQNLIITSIGVHAAAAALVEIWVGTGSTTAGTEVTGVNLNQTSSNTADATCRHTNTNVDAGSGLTLLCSFYSAATTLQTFKFENALILGQNDEVAINLVTDVGTTAVNIMGFYR